MYYQTTFNVPPQGEQSTSRFEVVVYIDTLEACFKWLHGHQIKLLHTLQAKHGQSIILRRLSGPQARFSWWLHLPQPSHEALTVLAEMPENQCHISRADYACDFPIEATFIDRHLRQKYRGTRCIYTYGPSTYYDFGKTTRNIMPYSDKRSKVTGQPCYHIDIRVTGKRTLESSKLYRIEELLNPPDPLWLLKRQTKLEKLDRSNLLKGVSKVTSVKRAPHAKT